MRETIEGLTKNYLFKLDLEYKTLIDSLDNPEIILTKLFNPDDRQPYYNYITKALEKEGLGHHELQKHLIDKIREYFLEFDDEVEISMLYKSQFPTDLRIKYKKHPVMSFSFYFHTYVCKVPRSKVSHLEEEIQRGTLRIKKLTEEKDKWISRFENPFNMLMREDYNSSGLMLIYLLVRDFFTLLRKWKTIKELVYEETQKYTRLIEDELKDIRRYENDLKKLNEIIPNLERKYKKWEEKMVSLGYKEEVSNEQR